MTRDLKEAFCDGAVPDVMTSAAAFFMTAVLFEELDDLGNLHRYTSFIDIIHNITQYDNE